MRNIFNKKKPIVIFDGLDWQITLREVLFSVFLFGILMLIGALISGCIKSHVHNKNLVYYQAAQIKNNPEEFQWALETDIGNAFVEGKLKAIEPVTHEKLGFDVLSYTATYQHYNMHTRLVTRTRTDSKGRSHTYTTTETYWSWDTYKRENDNVKKVEFSGVEFNVDKFDLGGFYKTKVVSNGHNDRIVYEYIPTEITGSFYGEIKYKTISGKINLYDLSIEKLYEDFTSSCFNLVFWIIWVIFSIILMFVFYVHENYWLEK